MKRDDGYIKLYRGLRKKPWYSNGNCVRLFIHLLLSVSWGEQRIHGRAVHRGYMNTTYQRLANSLSMTRWETIKAMERLKAAGSVETKNLGRFVQICVVNFDEYQSADKEDDKHMPTAADLGG